MSNTYEINKKIKTIAYTSIIISAIGVASATLSILHNRESSNYKIMSIQKNPKSERILTANTENGHINYMQDSTGSYVPVDDRIAQLIITIDSAKAAKESELEKSINNIRTGPKLIGVTIADPGIRY